MKCKTLALEIEEAFARVGQQAENEAVEMLKSHFPAGRKRLRSIWMDVIRGDIQEKLAEEIKKSGQKPYSRLQIEQFLLKMNKEITLSWITTLTHLAFSETKLKARISQKHQGDFSEAVMLLFLTYEVWDLSWEKMVSGWFHTLTDPMNDVMAFSFESLTSLDGTQVCPDVYDIKARFPALAAYSNTEISEMIRESQEKLLNALVDGLYK